MTDQIEISLSSSLSEFDAAEWDACASGNAARPRDPFTSYRFLEALEESGSVGSGTGWTPHYLAARLDGLLIAVSPLYLKSHSQGEYVFDHSWAHAYEQAGGRYYPKLQIAVPFTPVTGRRLLCREGFDTAGRQAILQGTTQIARQNGIGSIHVTFCSEEEAIAGESLGYLHRTGQQFHWENRDYPDFDAFLAELSSRKRKNIRKERAQAQSFGGDIIHLTGQAIEPEHWDAFWSFYQDTGARKWGSPYLTRQFFDIIHETMRDDVLLVFAMRDGHPVAGALNFIGADTLFGRYWGSLEHHPCLHFEVCYYQAIDFAIQNGLGRVEAGAQGEHKLARGYLPNVTHSLHWIADPNFERAVDDFIRQERSLVSQEIEILTDYGPFKKTGTETDHD